MYTLRKADKSDTRKVFELYQRVTKAMPGGIARDYNEITDEYVQNFMQESSAYGLEFIIDNPDNKDEIIAEIHCHKMGPKVFDHIFSDLTIVIDPRFQGKGIGKIIFLHLLDHIKNSRPDILRVELVVKESHTGARALYSKIGFVAEGRFEKRFRMPDGSYDTDIPMVWMNTSFDKNFRTELTEKMRNKK